jgi:hypothetical protein
MNTVWKLNFFVFNIEGYGEFFSGVTPICSEVQGEINRFDYSFWSSCEISRFGYIFWSSGEISRFGYIFWSSREISRFFYQVLRFRRDRQILLYIFQSSGEISRFYYKLWSSEEISRFHYMFWRSGEISYLAI